MHGDHVGGLVVGGERAFPNATLRAARQEAEFWLSEQIMQAAPPPVQSQFVAAMNAIQPYTKAGRFKPFDGATALLPGITAQPAPGHTPGHTVYIIESNGEKLVVIGDLVHLAAVQLANPGVTFQFDNDTRMAVVSRTSLLADAAMHGYWLAGAHLAFPGLGHVRSSGKGYRLVPANYNGTP
jgi:glyoxylase-like metal-dependent hydrolase (beta-lactamase superfamily II)